MKTADLVTLLQGETSIAPLLADAVTGAAPRPPAVYKQSLPRGAKFPALVVHRYNGAQDQDMSGPIDTREDNFQVDVYSGTQEACDTVTDAVRAYLLGFTGTVDGAIVTGTYLEQDRDMPYLPNATQDGTAFRALLGFRCVTQVVTPGDALNATPQTVPETVDGGIF